MIFLRILILFLALTFNCYADNETDFVIANINNRIITNSDLQDRYQYVLSSAKLHVNSPEEKVMLLNQIVDKMIDEELIRQEAQNLKIELSEEEIENVIDSLALKQKQSVAVFKKSFVTKKLSFEAYKNQIKSELLWSKIVTDSLKSRIKITDFEIKEFFEQQKLNTDVTQYFIAEILIPSDHDAKTLAEKLAGELKHGANFKNIVKQFSRSPTAENNGEVGWVSKGDIDEKIYDTISKLQIGEYSDAIFLSDNYYIFKLLNKKSVTHIKDNDLNFARNRIFTRELEIEAKRYLMDLHKNAFIEVNRSKLAF